MQANLTTFVSYCRADSDFTLRMAADLKAGGANVWLDQTDILPGQRWDGAVERALTDASRMLVVLSPAAIASTNVMDEVSFALEEGKTVIPIIYQECTVPFRLRRLQHVDLRQDYDRGLQDLLRTLIRERTPVETPLPVQDLGTRPEVRDADAPSHVGIRSDGRPTSAEEHQQLVNEHPAQVAGARIAQSSLVGSSGWFAKVMVAAGVSIALIVLVFSLKGGSTRGRSAEDRLVQPASVERGPAPTAEPRQSASEKMLPGNAVVSQGLAGAGKAIDAQQQTGSVGGHVFDPTKFPLDGAIVTLAGVENGVHRTAKADSKGRFSFPQIQAGVYRVEATFPRFDALQQTVTVQSGRTSSLTFELRITGWPPPGR